MIDRLMLKVAWRMLQEVAVCRTTKARVYFLRQAAWHRRTACGVRGISA
jgi:hypothetical protein